MNQSIKGLIESSLTVVFVIYGIIFLIRDIFTSFLPFGILLIIALVCALHFLRVPAPEQASVEAIIGSELDAEEGYKLTTVAHRGAGLDAPENTLEAFKMCNDNGCEAIEFDIQLTNDDVTVVFHDSTLERMTDSTIEIGKTKWVDLAKIDLSVKHPFRDRYPNTNMPTLEQTVTQLLASGQKMFIDIKDNNTKMVKVIHDLYIKHEELYSKAIVTSFYPNLIYLIRKGNPKIVCSMAWRPYCWSTEYFKYPEGPGPNRYDIWYKHYFACVLDAIHAWALPRFIYYLLGLSVILLHKDAISPEIIYNWRQKGIRVIAWSVNSPTEKQHLARNLKITYLTDTLTGENSTHSTS